MKISDPATAFRLSKTILATIDLICAKQDLTRSQVYRRSIMEYLKNQNAIIADLKAPEPKEEWFAEWNHGRYQSHQVNKEKSHGIKSCNSAATSETFQSVFT